MKGELVGFILYESEDGEQKTGWLEQTIPVNSRIDVSGSHEGAAANLTVARGNADLEVKPDYDGELRVLHIDAVLNLDIRMYEEEGMDLIADLYSLKKELFPEKEETPYERLLISSTSRCRVAGRIATEHPEMQILQICHSSGEVKLRAMTEDMSRYARLESVFLKKNGQMEEKKVLKGRSYDGFAFLQLEGVNDRDAAEALRGAEVYVDRRHAIKLGADENFVCELIGLRAVDETGETIGTLRDVLKPNAVCDVYVFNTPRGELMIPALKRVVKTVDVDAGVMTLDSAALAEVAVWEDEPAERDE